MPTPPINDADLETLRDRIRELDRQLVALAAERVAIAREVGRRKREAGLATIDYAQERRVLDAATRRALRAGLESEVAQDLVARLIKASVAAQEEDLLRHEATGRGRRAVVVGGAGRMGRWTARFLAAQGWEAHVLDPAATAAENREAEQQLFGADLVLLATAPRLTAELYEGWVEDPPRGVLIDISSIKTPLVAPIRNLQRAGARVASIHPMFGPSTLMLRDAEVVVCETGDDGATNEAEALFAPTTARLVRVPLEEHDRIMADLLSLAHAAAIAFSLALPESEHPVHSTTFRALESLAATVVRESPDVYWEIQAENPNSLAALERLRRSVEAVRAAVDGGDREAFFDVLAQGRRRTPDP